ncbi:RNA polymerase Rpc34 [Limtongia smithiae]|uniref:RNA polymerase Rpc34 n=1 Tax=Limtongia smithiae TaxID=1125753 RepID=UPI0034CD5B81
MPPVRSAKRGSAADSVAAAASGDDGTAAAGSSARPYTTLPPSPPSSSTSSASGSMHFLENLSKGARALYTKMLAATPDGRHVFTQSEMTSLSGASDIVKLMELIQENTNLGLVKMVKQGDDLCYQVIRKEEAEKIQSMNKDEAMVYSYIEASGTEGIWTKTIKAKTNLHQSVVQRCLKSLESKRYIKNIKSVKYPTRKIYMLASLQPSIDVTGDPWFTDSELDTEFVSTLLAIIRDFIASESLPNEDDKPLAPVISTRKKSRKSSKSSAPPPQIVYDQLSFPATFTRYPTLAHIHDFVQTSGVTTVELSQANIKALVDVLVYDGKIESLDNGVSFMAILGAPDTNDTRGGAGATTIESGSVFTESPCGLCPVFDLCKKDGPVNPEECVYLDEWLVQ